MRNMVCSFYPMISKYCEPQWWQISALWLWYIYMIIYMCIWFFHFTLNMWHSYDIIYIYIYIYIYVCVYINIFMYIIFIQLYNYIYNCKNASDRKRCTLKYFLYFLLSSQKWVFKKSWFNSMHQELYT